MRLFKYDLLIMNIRLNRLDARQRLAILNAKCNLCNKNFIVFSLPFVSMWSDKEAGRPLHPSTYMMSDITRALLSRQSRHTQRLADKYTSQRTRAASHIAPSRVPCMCHSLCYMARPENQADCCHLQHSFRS